jgi:UDP-N-acetylmuramoylalanine--D-glutamate ligase
VVVSDLKSPEALQEAREELDDLSLEFALGGHSLTLLENTDKLFLSAGVPADLPFVARAREKGIGISNDSDLFLEHCPAPVLGITGSAGKSTTTALVGRIAEKVFAGSERKVWVGGNIGNPLIQEIGKISPQDLVVMELSSFQLELMNLSPEVAAVLNLTPNHLDRHRTMQAYTSAKSRILAFQSHADKTILGRDDPGAWALRDQVKGSLLSFGKDRKPDLDGTYIQADQLWLQMEGVVEKICDLGTIQLRGDHNILNVAAACAISAAAGLPTDAMKAAIHTFKGIPHRLEFVRSVHGVDWYNDSIATSPERAIAAMLAFDESLILLAGGRDKDLPWKDFARVVAERVDHLILFGEAAGKIRRAVEAVGEGERPISVEVRGNLEEAVQAAAEIAAYGEVVLLAPGGTSFDEFRDFVERGERYSQMVMAL